MQMRLSSITYVVREYDEAIRWFVDVLGFTLVDDTPLGGCKRWVRVAPPGNSTALLLARAEGLAQQQAVGHAAGGRVAYFLNVDDFVSTHQNLLARGVRFRETPRFESYGTVAVFEDIYGNCWDLIGPPA